MMPLASLIILLGLTTGCASRLQAKPEHQTQVFKEHVKEGLVAEAVVLMSIHLEVFNSDVQSSLELWIEQSAYQLCVARRLTICNRLDPSAGPASC